MLENILPFTVNSWQFLLSSLLLTACGTALLYVVLFYILRSIFRKFERDIALVTLNVSAYPVLALFIISSLKILFNNFQSIKLIKGLQSCLTATLIIAFSYWLVQLFIQVFIYYLKEYTQQTEVMWDDVLLPILEAVVPVIIFLIGGVFVLKSFGLDLTGIWVTLGGATFIIGFAVKDILANFFSGIVLLIDTPFQFGDVLCLQDGSIGMLQKIGIRVTKIYMFNTHCDVYIPNSILQGQNITNLSRPTAYYHYSTSIEIPSQCDLYETKKVIEEVVLGHPDTLGDIEEKMGFMEKYYNSQDDQNLSKQQSLGKLRLKSENKVNLKLEEINQSLESLAVTLQFAEKGGITPEEILNVQQEYEIVLQLIGLKAVIETNNNRATINFQEAKDKDSLIQLVRAWYKVWIRDVNLLDNDQFLISDEWERKINLLKRRVQKLYQKISNPQAEETRLDDYVMDLIKWFKDKFKEPRSKWQEPQIRMAGVNHDEARLYVKFKLNFFIDDIKLEDGKRGDRVSSQIYQEILRYLKNRYPDLHGNYGKERDLKRAEILPEK